MCFFPVRGFRGWGGGGVLTIESKGLGANLPIQGRVRPILV